MPQAPVMEEPDQTEYTRFRNQIDRYSWEEELVSDLVESYLDRQIERSEDDRSFLYHRLWSCCHDQQQWERQQEQLKVVRDWFRGSVDLDLRPILCPPEEDIKQWYARIYDHTAPYRAREVEILTEEYLEHLAAIPKSHHQISDWARMWQSLIFKGKAAGVAECSRVTSWFPAFIRAVVKVPALKDWAAITNIAKRDRLGALHDELTTWKVLSDLESSQVHPSHPWE